MDTSGENLSRSYVVLMLVQGNGERLPCLVETETWIPARVATRWAVRYRRYKVQSSTLMDNLRVLRRIYEWAATVGGFELDNVLTSGKWLNARQIESLANYLRTANRALTVSDAAHSGGSRNAMETIDAGTFDHQLSVAENFLKWSLDSMNRGGISTLTITELGAERLQLELLFKSLRIGARPADRREPLEEAEISAIRHAIGPQRSAQSGWVFSKEVFAKGTKLRNWLMFETALNLGLRRGELLKLRVDCLPRGSDDGVRLLRLPDDPRDARAREPAVKTAERVIPAPRQLLAAFRAYLTLSPPLGRMAGKSPYLFVTSAGNPVSLDTADDIITAIGRYCGGTHLSWHRLRHTWAERMAEALADQANGIDKLMYLGGWTNPASPRHYIQRGAFDSPFLIAASGPARPWGKVIMRAQFQQARVKVDGIAMPLQNH